MIQGETDQARYNMVEQQIRPWDVLDPAVLSVIAEIDRADYFDQALRPFATSDTSLPLPGGGSSLPPRMEARLLQSLELQGSETVLEVGCGSGYLTACLAALSRHVTSICTNGERLEAARMRLDQQLIANVTLKQTDPYDSNSLPDGPFDAILIAGGVDQKPEHLLELLRPGGRLIAMIGSQPVQRATLYRRINNDQWSEVSHFDSWIEPLAGQPITPSFQF